MLKNIFWGVKEEEGNEEGGYESLHFNTLI